MLLRDFCGLGRDSPLRENDAFRFGTEHGDTEYGNRYGNAVPDEILNLVVFVLSSKSADNVAILTLGLISLAFDWAPFVIAGISA